MTTTKSRDISFLEFLKVLTEEYLIAEFRSKIYYYRKDNDFYKRLMEGKKEKIQDLSIRNGFKNIFNDNEEKEKHYRAFYPEFGVPIFHSLNLKDIALYYKKGTTVSFVDENGKSGVGEIQEVFLEENKCVINEKTVVFSKIRRIF